MKLRLFAGTILASLVVSATLGQGRGGGGNKDGCYNPEIKVVISSTTTEGIAGDGLEYTGTLFACGSNDATFGHSEKNRSVFFNLNGRIPNSYASAQENWLTGVQPFKGGFNVHRLGLIRDAADSTKTTWMTGQFDGPDRKTYRLRMTPEEGTETGQPELLGEGVNSPFDTSPVGATFHPGCSPCTENPYGEWEVVGAYQKVDEYTGTTYVQIGTIFRVGNTWIKMGQFQLPFRMTVKLLSAYPTECPTC
jgi:hypothetical protein